MAIQGEPDHLTVEEWRELAQNSHDIKHEYIDGQVYAMSGGSLAHARVGLNVCIALENALRNASVPEQTDDSEDEV